MNKAFYIILVVLSLLLVFGFLSNSFAQQTKIYYPRVIGALYMDTTIIKDTTGGIVFIGGALFLNAGNVWIGGAEIKDSSNYLAFSTPPSFPTIAWMKNEYFGDTVISAANIKVGAITTTQLAQTLWDSLFTGETTAGIDNRLTTLKTQYNVLFNDSGDFHPDVLGFGISYDTASRTLTSDFLYDSLFNSTGHFKSNVFDFGLTYDSVNHIITSDFKYDSMFTAGGWIKEGVLGDGLELSDGVLQLGDSIQIGSYAFKQDDTTGGLFIDSIVTDALILTISGKILWRNYVDNYEISMHDGMLLSVGTGEHFYLTEAGDYDLPLLKVGRTNTTFQSQNIYLDYQEEGYGKLQNTWAFQDTVSLGTVTLGNGSLEGDWNFTGSDSLRIGNSRVVLTNFETAGTMQATFTNFPDYTTTDPSKFLIVYDNAGNQYVIPMWIND